MNISIFCSGEIVADQCTTWPSRRFKSSSSGAFQSVVLCPGGRTLLQICNCRVYTSYFWGLRHHQVQSGYDDRLSVAISDELNVQLYQITVKINHTTAGREAWLFFGLFIAVEIAPVAVPSVTYTCFENTIQIPPLPLLDDGLIKWLKSFL